MRSARVIPIREPRLEDYAEPAYFEERWEEKVTRRLKQDRDAKWQFVIALVCVAIWGAYVIAAVLR